MKHPSAYSDHLCPNTSVFTPSSPDGSLKALLSPIADLRAKYSGQLSGPKAELSLNAPVTPGGAPSIGPSPAADLSHFDAIPDLPHPLSSSPSAVLDMIEAWARGAYLEVKSQLLAGGIASPAATVSAILEAAAASPELTKLMRRPVAERHLLPPPSPFLLAAAASPAMLGKKQQGEDKADILGLQMADVPPFQPPAEVSESFIIRRVSGLSDEACGVWGSGGGAEETVITAQAPSPLGTTAVMTGATPAGTSEFVHLQIFYLVFVCGMGRLSFSIVVSSS